MIQSKNVLGRSSDTRFRPDINGLRAWAVIAVVLYHFNVPGFSGGFVGVDVFFVISGFLMTSIIVGGLERRGEHGFSLFGFYLARAKRILPALIVLCGALLALGWLALPSIDYRILATHALVSLAFLSNVKFWREAGYFDVASHDKWLLHTWSLSVEWQFYLLLPLALMLVWKLRPSRRAVMLSMIAATLLSLGLSIGFTASNPSAAFYLLPTRAWEMLAGGLVFLLAINASPGARRWLEISGFALIIFSVATADPQAWPGAQAMLPVVGACLMLVARRPDSPWTAPWPLQALGRWSYSIYLWHWPLVVGLAYVEWSGEPIPIAIGLLASVALGAASYRWVEAPARGGVGRVPPVWGAVAMAAAVCLVTVPALMLRLAGGVPGRLPAQVEAAANEAGNVNPRRTECHSLRGTDFRRCVYGGENVRAVLVGDSHASTVATAMQAALTSPADGVLAFSYTSCPTIFGATHVRAGLECAAFNDWAKEQIDALPAGVPVLVVNRGSAYPFGNSSASSSQSQPPTIYFHEPPPTAVNATYLSEYHRRLVESACRLSQDRPVYLMRPIPEMPVDVPRYVARKLLLGKPVDIEIGLDDYSRRHSFIVDAQDEAARQCGVQVLDPLPWLCRDGRCFGVADGRPRYYDDNHLSEFGNRALVPMFRGHLINTIERTAAH